MSLGKLFLASILLIASVVVAALSGMLLVSAIRQSSILGVLIVIFLGPVGVYSTHLLLLELFPPPTR